MKYIFLMLFFVWSSGVCEIDLSNKTFNEKFDAFEHFGTDTLKEKLKAYNTKFNKRAIFSDFLKQFIFNDSVDFQHAVFYKPSIFIEAEFKNNADFESVKFSGEADFSFAKFSNKLDLKFSKFYSRADFRYTGFYDEIDFSNVEFRSRAYFELVEFNNYTDFTSVKFNDEVEFKSATFYQEADFRSAKFYNKLDFRSAEFYNRADFRSVKFYNKVDFSSVKFYNRVDFSSAEFKGKVDFSKIELKNEISFRKTTLPDTLFFNEVKTKEIIDFRPSFIPDTLDYKCEIFLYNSDIDKIIIDDKFRLGFREPFNEYTHKVTVYEQVIKSHKDKGILETCKHFNIEYNRLQYEHKADSKSEYKIMSWFNKYWWNSIYWLDEHWWNFRYNKEWILKWTAFIIFIFYVMNAFLLNGLQNHVYPLGVKNYVNPNNKLLRKYSIVYLFRRFIHNPLLYTLIIFFGLKLDINTLKKDNHRFRNSFGTFYILVQYSTGIVCMVFIVNFIIGK